MEKAEPFDCCCISQWRRCLSACVMVHREHFEHILWWIHGSMCQVNAM